MMQLEGSSPPKKRKTVQFVEGTSTGNVDLDHTEEAISSNDAILSRLSLKKIVRLNKNLTDEQKIAVGSIGFGGLLHLKCTQLKHPLCKWLLKRFDPTTRKLSIHGHKVHVTTKLVEEILGLPNRGPDVPQEGPSEDIKDLCLEFDISDSSILLGKLEEKLLNCQSNGDEFKRMYVIYVIGFFLLPTSDRVVQNSMLHAVKDTNAIASYNWSKYMLDHLVLGIERGRKLKSKYVYGCFFILMIIFLEHFSPTQVAMKHHNIRPAIGFWTNEEVNKRINFFDDMGGFKCEEAIVFAHNRIVPEKFDEVSHSTQLESKSAVLETKIDEVKNELIGLKDIVMKNCLDQNANLTKVYEVKHELNELKDVVLKNCLDQVAKLTDKLSIIVNFSDQVEKLTTALNSVVDKVDQMERRWSEDKINKENALNADVKKYVDAFEEKNMGSSTNSSPPNKVPLGKAHEKEIALIKSPLNNVRPNKVLSRKVHLKKVPPSKPSKSRVCRRLPDEASVVEVTSGSGRVITAPIITRSDGWEYMKDDDKLDSFLFSSKKNPNEIVVANKMNYIQRERIKNLLPKKFISACIIDTFAWQLTHDARSADSRMHKWYMPSVMSQQILALKISNVENVNLRAAQLRNCYLGFDKYSGPLMECREIFLPVNYNENHWILCVIHFTSYSVRVLDSCTSKRTQDDIKNRTLLLMYVIDKMLDLYDHVGYKTMESITTFAIEFPESVPQQPNGYDCGLYVCKMMENYQDFRGLIDGESAAERRNFAFRLWRHQSNERNPVNIVKCEKTSEHG